VGRDLANTTNSNGGVPSNISKKWVSLLDAQTRAQMEWVLRRDWRVADTCEEKRLSTNRYNYAEGRTILRSKTGRVSLVSVHRRLRSFRDILVDPDHRRYTKRKHRRDRMTTSQFLDSSVFVNLVELTSKTKNISYIDAILDICRTRNIEVESIPELLTPKLRKLIQNEATNAHMLKKGTGKKLPI